MLSDNTKIAIITVTSCIYVYITGSILFGWPALYPIIIDEGQYNELCDPASQSSSDGSSTITCEAQKVRANLIFTIGYLFDGFSNLLGVATDRMGPLISTTLGSIANIIGLVMWAYSDSKGLDMWIPGTVFIGLGEGLTFFACFYGANLLTKHKTLFVSLLSGLWNAGGLNMCIVQFLYFKFGISRKISLMFTASIITIMFVISVLFFYPIKIYMPGDKPKFRPVWVTVREYLNEKRDKANIEMAEKSNEENETQEEPIKKQSKLESFKLLFKSVLSIRFCVLLVYAITCGFAISYGLGTMEYQYANLTTNHEFYDQMFSIVSSLGIVIIPLWSLVIDKLGLHVYCSILVVLAMIFYGVLLIPSMPVHVIDFFIFSVVRVSVGTGVSNFNVRFFDPSLFGSMTGIIWFVQNPLVDFVLNKLHGDWFYPNLILLFTPLFSIGYIVVTYRHHKKTNGKNMPYERVGNGDDEEEAANLVSSKGSEIERSESEGEENTTEQQS